MAAPRSLPPASSSSAAIVVVVIIISSATSMASEGLASCSRCMRTSDAITCPDYLHPERFTVGMSSSEGGGGGAVFELKCRADAEGVDLSLLEGCVFPPVRYVRFVRCPLLNASFGDLLGRMGLRPEGVEGLSFVHVGWRQRLPLRPWHLRGLEGLRRVELRGNNFTALPEGLLDAAPRLTSFSFTVNAVGALPEALFAHTPLLAEVSLWSNGLSSLPDGLFEGLPGLANLSLWSNDLSEVRPQLLTKVPSLRSLELSHNRISRLDPGVFSNLPRLRKLLLNSNELEFLPEGLLLGCPDLEVLRLEFNRIASLPQGLLAGSPKVQHLDLSSNLLTGLPEGAFGGLTSLRRLKLRRNGLRALPRGAFSDLSSLEVLDLQSNVLGALPSGAFDGQGRMDVLILKNNSLRGLPDGVFSRCGLLQKLYLSHNAIGALRASSFPGPETSLRVLDLGSNGLSFSSSGAESLEGRRRIALERRFPLEGQVHLEELHLSNNAIDAVPQAFGTSFRNLSKLYLEGNRIEYVDGGALSFASANVFVDLRDNRIRSVSLEAAREAPRPKRVVSVNLDGNPLACDCHLYHFARLLQQSPRQGATAFRLNVMDKRKLRCSYPGQGSLQRPVMEVDAEALTCQVPRCPARCACFTRPHDGMLLVDCAFRGLRAVPRLEGHHLPKGDHSVSLDLSDNSITSLGGLGGPAYSALVNLSLANNGLSSLNGSWVDGSLLLLGALDVRGNNLTRLPRPLLRLLNSTGATLSLGGNPWLCDCDLVDLHEFLRDPSRKVTDSHNIRCHNLEELVIDLTKEDLCPIIEQPVVIASITCSTIFLFFFFVFGTVSIYRYKQDMKVWLFTHRWCLWAVAEEEEDANKKYDAFISYSNKDEEFVNTVLVPGLESGDPKYRVCLHYRDWVPGEYIQNQIDQSIEASRRTIVILSSNFIENVWGQIEFKTAHSKALKDRTNRIIVIVFGELPPESELDEELNLYLSTRTYLHWRDNKFWEKLRYAMPHPQEFIHKKQKRKYTDKLELVKSNSKQYT